MSSLAQSSKTLLWDLFIFPPTLPGNTGQPQSWPVALRGPGKRKRAKWASAIKLRPSDGVNSVMPRAVVRCVTRSESTRKERCGTARLKAVRWKVLSLRCSCPDVMASERPFCPISLMCLYQPTFKSYFKAIKSTRSLFLQYCIMPLSPIKKSQKFSKARGSLTLLLEGDLAEWVGWQWVLRRISVR